MAKKKAPQKSTKPPVKSKAKAPAKASRKPLKTKKVSKSAPKKTAKAAPKRAVKKVARNVTPKKAAPKAKATRKAPVKTAKAKVTKKTQAKVVKKPMALAKKKAPAKAAKKPMAKVMKKPVAKAKTAKKDVAPPPPVRLQRERRRLPEAEAEAFTGTSGDARLLRAAKSGHDELQSELKQHTESSPELTAGDVDAKWQDAYALGDEAPGGDNMTPDQDRVDDIGKALGIEYDDDEELQGGGELAERDEHRWELDPESKEDEDE